MGCGFDVVLFWYCVVFAFVGFGLVFGVFAFGGFGGLLDLVRVYGG